VRVGPTHIWHLGSVVERHFIRVFQVLRCWTLAQKWTQTEWNGVKWYSAIFWSKECARCTANSSATTKVWNLLEGNSEKEAQF
jgi:hypothetical protein